MKKVLLLMALVLFGGAVQGQQNKWLKKADSCLRAGNCDCAQGFYDTYKDITGGRDKKIEQKIADCIRGNADTNSPQKRLPTKISDWDEYERLSDKQVAWLIIAYRGESGEVLTVHVGDLQLRMVYVEGGTFLMGAQKDNPKGANYDADASANESPVHSVTLDGYFIGETEVTQELWESVMGSNPTNIKGDNLPVEGVSWNDVQEFIGKLNSLTGLVFRLPTEVEWEYAARGGNKSRGYKYSGSNTLGDVAWYRDNSRWGAKQVKCKQANELGLYDMIGNVWEYCKDLTNDYSCVLRGGGWGSFVDQCRVAKRKFSNREDRFNTFGFRLVLVP